MRDEQLLRFEKGQVLFRQGDEDDSLYIIQSGKVRIHIDMGDDSLPLVDVGEGSIVGEMSFLSGLPRTATVTAREALWVLRYPSSLLMEKEYGLDDWTLSLGRQLVRRLRKTTAELAEHLKPELQPVMLEGAGDKALSGWTMKRDPWEPRLYLRGDLPESALPRIMKEIEALASLRGSPVILDFSETLDVDRGFVAFLGRITQGERKKAEMKLPPLKIDNVQLLRDRLREIRGLKTLLHRKTLPLKEVEAGEVLIKQGEPGSAMYMVESGHLGIFRDTPQGRKILSQAGPGELVGEMVLINQGPRSATVEALERCTLHEISAADYEKNVYHLPSWYMKILKELVRRLKKTSDLLEKRGGVYGG